MDSKSFSSLRSIIKEFRVLKEVLIFLLRRPEINSVNVPVILIPGLMFSDWYLFPVMFTFKRIGVPVYGWGMGINTGYSERKKDRLAERIDSILSTNGSERAIVIGWSMGGVYARQWAYEYPQKAKLVLSLGTPFRIDMSPLFERLYGILSKDDLSRLNAVLERQKKYRIPAIQIYTKKDGVVPWKDCIADGYIHKEVDSTHLGLPYQDSVFNFSDHFFVVQQLSL